MDRNVPNGTLEEFADSAPPEAWLFAQAILDRPIPRIISPEARARAERERLEALAPYSRRHAEELCRLQEAETEARRTRESLEWAARIWPKCQSILDDLLRKEAEEREAWRRAEKYADELREGSWDASKHPRGGFSQNRGWWSPSGGSASATAPAVDAGPLRTTAFQTAQATAQVAGSSGAASPTWPMTGPASSWLPKVASAIDAAASAAGTLARALLGGLRNATMGAYWDRVPGAQAMPKIWAWELDKRVREGKLSREDAVAIFNTAVLGAEAQGFKPTGGTMSAVHNSALDFLGKAEAVYFARKKKTADAKDKSGSQGAKAGDASSSEVAPGNGEHGNPAALDPEHHIATDKNWVSILRGGPWSPRLEKFFKKAGLTLQDAANKVRIPGHQGPHPEEYHREIFRRLRDATAGKRGAAYKDALLKELDEVAREARTPGSKLNELLTK